jgi:predicted acetylornithine/succinylornithine family transaminase
MTRDRMNQLIESAKKVLIQNYKQQPVVLQRGEGLHLWDVAGNRYLDLTAGIAACPLGHAHPRLSAAVAEQAKRLIHVSNLFYIEAQIRLAETLAAKVAPSMGPARSFFCNSGAEANEAALKLAKRYQTTTVGRPDRIEVIAYEGSFHGRSIATVALTGQEKYRSGFGPLVEWARIIPWPTSASDGLDAITEHTCAVILEPIQAEGGIRMPPPGFLKALRERCTATGTVLIFDEVQTGIGRCGAWFRHQMEGAAPDIMSLAKGLAGGVPIGAIVATEKLATGFAAGAHASTFGGNPLAAAAALCVFEVLEEERVLDNVKEMGAHLARGLAKIAERHSTKVAQSADRIRGVGLLAGLALQGDAVPVVQRCRERGVLLSVAGGTVVRFAPALIATAADLDQGLEALDAALDV